MSDREPNPDWSRFEIGAESEGDATIVRVSGELDLATVAEFDGTLRSQLASGPVRLDLSGLTFMDSSGLHALDDVLRDAPREGWKLSISPALQHGVRQILELTGMMAVLPFETPARREHR